jgi:hypothetical protein
MNIEMMEPLCFNNIIHMNSFVSYLMRTDAKQKWTTKETLYNIISLKEIDGNFKTEFFGDNIDTKKKIATYIRKQITCTKLSKKFKMGLYYLELGDNESVNKDNLFELVNTCIDAIEKDAVKEETICYVLHIDQGEFHVHRIYLEI